MCHGLGSALRDLSTSNPSITGKERSKKHKVRIDIGHLAKPLLAIGGSDDLKPKLGKRFFQKLDVVGQVVND